MTGEIGGSVRLGQNVSDCDCVCVCVRREKERERDGFNTGKRVRESESCAKGGVRLTRPGAALVSLLHNMKTTFELIQQKCFSC